MNEPTDAALEFAAILGEAIARVHLSGKQAETINANATVVDGRGGCGSVGLTKGDSNDATIPQDTNLSKAEGS